jgi:putative ABC transport system permease protein
MTTTHPAPPRFALALLAAVLPPAEREEVLADLCQEHRQRHRTAGRLAAWTWVWRQALTSLPVLARRGWWRGWSGFEPAAERLQPGGPMFETFAIDVRFALRRLRTRRSYTVLTALTLALGVAGTAAVAGIARRLLLEPLPVRAEEEVVVFWQPGAWSETYFLSLRPDLEGFSALAIFREADATLRVGDAPAQLVQAISGSSELFRVLGADAERGGTFRPGDDRLGGEPVAVLSQPLWRRLGGDPALVGQRIELSGVQRTVLGVMPEGFWFPDPQVEVWLSEDLDPENGSGNYGVIGRLPPGKTVADTEPQVSQVTRLLGERFEFPVDWDLTKDAELTPLRDYVLGPVQPSVLALLAAMAVILLVACVNVAALMLGQVDTRGTELAMRSALGAGRGRLLRQLVVEAAAIGVVAGLFGAALATVGFGFLVRALPLGALADAAQLDWRIFATSMAVSLGAATVISLIPGSAVARSNLQERLSRSRTGGVVGRGGRIEHVLVVGQVALVLLLAAASALLIRSVENRRAIDPGVDVDGIAVLDLQMPASLEAERVAPLLREIVAAVAVLPGVESAAVTQRLPLRGMSDNWGMAVEGREFPDVPVTAMRVVSPGYFETMGITVTSGRGFADVDRTAGATEGTVVINEALAKEYFPGQDPLGRRIAFSSRMDRIVGVVEDVAEGSLSPEAVPARYVVHEQVPFFLSSQTIVAQVKPGVDPVSILEQARRAVQAAAPQVALQEVTTMSAVFTRGIGPALQVMALLSLLAGLALALGAVGIYGVVSHFVARRKRDWGIRMVLGMRPVEVVAAIVGRGGALIATGIAIGLAAFLGLARLLASFLYGVGAADPLALASAAGVLAAAGLVAAALPARRASQVDPAVVLREQ